MSLSGMMEIDHRTASDFLFPRHYSGRVPSISKAFGWYENDELKAVCTFGKPSSPFLCKGICGNDFASSVYELNRLCRVDGFTKPLSQFVAYCLRKLRILNWIIVSYADTAMNHHGYVYQACNFLYTGMTKERTDIYTGEGKHSRHYTQDDRNCGQRQVRSAKHRYVYFCTRNRNLRTAWGGSLKYPILPYPKGDNAEDYQLGMILKPKIIRVELWQKQDSESASEWLDRLLKDVS